MKNKGPDFRKINTLPALFADCKIRFGDLPAFVTRRENDFERLSFADLFDRGAALATALASLGVQARDHVVLFADNRSEWIICDYAVQLCGAADVPRGSDVTHDDIRHIVTHCGARVLILEHEALLKRVLANREALPNVAHIVLIDEFRPELATAGITLHKLSDLLRQGEQLRQNGERVVEERMAGVKSDDLFTIIYTSGTTGTPKGVMLTHANMISQIASIPFPIDPSDRVLSILPVWHIFERVFEMVTIAYGCPQYYTNVRRMREDLRLIRPTFMASAPRLWEMIYQGIATKVADGPAIARVLFNLAKRSAKAVRGGWRFLRGLELDLEGRSLLQSTSLFFRRTAGIVFWLIPFLLLDLIVLRKIRASLGGRFRGTVSGGGALPVHVDAFFNDIGIPVLEGYGLTETSPGLAFRTFDRLVVGSVGPLFTGTDLRLVDMATGKIIYPGPGGRGRKGEIHVRGPQVMKGYYKNPEATAKVLNDGWFNTGDLGLITFNNTLRIVGRSKETIVLSSGENVEPVPIENRLTQSALISMVMVTGQDQKYLTALIVPNPEAMREYGESVADLSGSAPAREAVLAEVRRLVNAQTGFKAFERVVDVRLLPKAFEPGDELSAKLSVKRHVVAERYAALIDSMYSR